MTLPNRSLVFAALLCLAGCHAETPPQSAKAPAPSTEAPPEASAPTQVVPEPAPKAATKEEASDWCAAPVHSSAEGEHGVSGALMALNQTFLQEHANARRAACAKLESERLVIRYAFGTLEARYRGQDFFGGPVNVLPPEAHPIKDVSHVVLLSALLFLDESASRQERVTEALRNIDAALAQLDDAASPTTRLIPQAQLPAQKRILHASREALSAFAAGKLDEAGKRKYFTAVRPEVDANLRAVSGALVREIDRRVTQVHKAVDALDPNAWKSLLVVVLVVHQERARAIGVQYFERLLQESAGEGARNEQRLVVAENAWQPADQLGQLANHLVDQDAGGLVFDDVMRMQWDVLGNDDGTLDALLPKRAPAPPESTGSARDRR